MTKLKYFVYPIVFLIGFFFPMFIAVVGCTSSMYPSIDCNDILVVRPTVMLFSPLFSSTLHQSIELHYLWIADEIQVGDVVMFRYGKPVDIAHRVIAKCDDYGVETKGDNNEYSDGCIPYWAITQKVIFRIKIPPN